MPAMLDDPTSPAIYRTSGAPPYPTPSDPQIPPDIVPRQVTLRDRVTIATLIPFSSSSRVPSSLLVYLCDQLNREIEKGDTYPMISAMPLSSFGPYWFANFGAVMLLGEIDSVDEVMEMEREGRDWGKECLGSFYIKPNYPGRSSHVCNGGFLVTDAARNRGVGRLMGEGYLEWAPKLSYTYSVFNLVYETNVASCRIWDALGFKRIGRVKGCGNLRSHPNELIDAIIYGRDLGPEGEDFVSEERFDKIRFYLKHGKYPNGADRAEKSRLRSAATHYKLVPAENDNAGDGAERLMLKDKEVVADPQRQYEIARQVHVLQHGGINKTTATIAEKYHWVRIKETVSLVIKNCADCKEMTRVPSVRPDGVATKRPNGTAGGQGGVSAAGRLISIQTSATTQMDDDGHSPRQDHSTTAATPQPELHHHQAPLAPVANMRHLSDYGDMPLDPQIMEDVTHHLTQYHHQHHDHDHDHFSNQDPHQTLPDPRLATNPHIHHHHQPHQPNGYEVDVDNEQEDQDDEAVRAAEAEAEAARVAQEAMVDFDGGNADGDGDEERELKRQLIVAGYGDVHDGEAYDG
ncbi:MAG: hypothetical protein M1830_009606 [Pleopsidium flavum]|nr:MAG: hypothetical protein M1830_009606 [Pleopsidium flavum]